jgi:hypothetical protein
MKRDGAGTIKDSSDLISLVELRAIDRIVDGIPSKSEHG